MTEIVGVGFIKASKTYYFDPRGEQYRMGELVIVETSRGMELGHISIANREVEDSEIVAPLKAIERRATDDDLAHYRENLAKRESAMKVCESKIKKHNLDMKLVDAEYTINGSKVIFYFSADGRVDFRELVKDLASHFHMRIELRQIGVRDEARMLGGIGICGRPFCCSRWLHDFQPVSIKMAKQQNLSLNPSKISGCCGSLMCCLNFENKTYQELRKGMPNVGERIMTPDGPAKVMNVDLFNGKVDVRMFEKNNEKDSDSKDGNKDDREEILSQGMTTYFKHEISRIEKKETHNNNNNGGKNSNNSKNNNNNNNNGNTGGKKKKGRKGHKRSQIIDDEDAENLDDETLKELEMLTRD